MNRTKTLDAALSAVKTRGQAYGTPENNFLRIARRWNVHLLNRYGARVELDQTDVAAMMADLKLARLEETPSHQDSWTDLAGYAACGAEVSAVAGDLLGRIDSVEAVVEAALAEPHYQVRTRTAPDGHPYIDVQRVPSGTIIPINSDELDAPLFDDGRRV